jgi:hypothetical protein
MLKSLKVLVNDSHVEVLNAKRHSLKMYSFNVLEVDHEWGEFADGDEAVFGGSDLYDRLLRTSLK